MPELSEEKIRWMRNRFVEILTRTEEITHELGRIRDELNQVVDALGRALPPEVDEKTEL